MIDSSLPPLLQGPPRFGNKVWIAPSADVIGGVSLGDECSVWYQAVLRGDLNTITAGPCCNFQDGVIVHMANDLPVSLGERVTVGHRAILHACQIADECLIGMGAILLDGCEIGPRCLIGAGALLPPGMVVPEGSLVMGVPGKIIRSLSMDEQLNHAKLAEKYRLLAAFHRDQNPEKTLLPH